MEKRQSEVINPRWYNKTMSGNRNKGTAPVKTGLVCAGGGSKGSYAIGVCKALDQAGRHFDVISGTSIGALVGAMMVQRDLSQAIAFGSQISPEGIAKNLFVFPDRYETKALKPEEKNAFFEMFCKDGPSIEPLREGFAKVFDYERFQASPTQFACMTYNVTQSRPAPFYKDEMKPENTLDILMASCAYFPAFNMVRIGDNYHADGGWSSNVPWPLALQMGAQELTIISLYDPEEIEEEWPEAARMVFRPILKLGYVLDFRQAVMQRQIVQGYLEGLKYLNLAPGYLYTFYREDWFLIRILETLADRFLRDAMKDLTDEVLEECWQALLGYVPAPLKNRYMEHYRIGRVLEILALSAQVDPYQQYHFLSFIGQLLNNLNHFQTRFDPDQTDDPARSMLQAGLEDMLVFFHSALVSYDGKLPESFNVFKSVYILPYYLGLGWYFIEKYGGFLFLRKTAPEEA